MKMKTLKTIFLGSLAAFFMTACQNDEIETPSTPTIGENEALVDFTLNADITSQDGSVRTFSPTYSAGNFQIYAFKREDKEYKYFKTIDTSAMTYNSTSKKLTGKATVDVGAYKFLTLYGTGTAQKGLKTIDWTKETTLKDATLQLESQLGGEIFLPIKKNAGKYLNMADALTTYYFKIDKNTGQPNETVNDKVVESLRRAVSRVDILMISAEKKVDAQGKVTYTEREYTGEKADITGAGIENIKFEFTDVNKGMSYIGDPSTAFNPTNKNLTATYTDFAKGGKITIGNGKATKVGTAGYNKYDKVEEGDIITKGAHIFGAYLFPNKTTAATTGLKITIKGKDVEDSRVFTMSSPIALEQNKVTLIKLYVTHKEDIFSTEVEFEVEVITDWLDANVVTGEIN